MGDSRRILVVEDQPDCAEIVCDLLWLMGHECYSVSTGGHALEGVRAFSPDLVLLDLTLPDMSGLDVARAIRRGPQPQPYLVAMTGWSHPEDRYRTLAAGFDAHLVKPVSVATLEQIVSATRLRKTVPELAIVR